MHPRPSQVALVVKNLPAYFLTPGLRRHSPSTGNGNLFQYSCLENSKDRGAWWATVQGGCKELDTTKHAHHCIIVQISFTALETCALPVHPFPHTSPGNHMFYFLYNLLFLECHIVGVIWLVDFPDWPLSLRNTQFIFLHGFSWLFHFIFDDSRCGY